MKGGRTVYRTTSTGSRMLEQGRLRLLCVGLFFVLCFGSITARLVEMMIASPHDLPQIALPALSAEQMAAEEAEVKSSEAKHARGDMVDRNGVLLATSLMTASAFANPRELSNAPYAAEKLAKTLGLNKDRLAARLKSKKSFVWIKRHLTPAEQQAVNNLGIPGVYFLPEERRVYPYGNALSHVLGYVGVDNRGLAGLEKSFDRALMENPNGKPVKLSIDIRVQHILRDELKKAVEEFKAIGAIGVVAEVATGEIVAMSSLPDFDPNNPSRATEAQKFNRVALGTYEMGSTFKSFTTAMALDKGIVDMRGGYDATNPMRIATFTISDTHPKKRWLSVPEIFAYSSNIGTAKMALDAGSKAQKAFLEKMGMLKPMETELPERSQPLFPADWKDINTVTISYGHGISVSPLHLVRGTTALVNGGTLPKLTLLHDENREHAEGERVISAKTSESMRRLMRLVVKHGTASKAEAAGYRVGGKTGTAEKINAGGRYNENAKIASFVGVFPADAPKYVVLVMVDEPVGNKSTFGYATGGWVAAPVVGKVVARMAPMLGIMPALDTPADDVEQYWVDTEKKNVQTVKAEKKTPLPVAAAAPTTAALDTRYIHAAAY